MKWYALDIQLLPNRKRKDFIPYWYQPPFRDLNTKWRTIYSSLKRLNYRNATDRVSVFRATDKLHAMPNSGKKIYIIFCSWPLSSLLLKEIFFSPSRKAFNLRFCPVYITVTTSPSVLGWAWHKQTSRISGGFDLVSWTKLFFHVPEMYKIDSFFIFFLAETSEQHKERLFGIVTFVYFFPTRFVSS